MMRFAFAAAGYLETMMEAGSWPRFFPPPQCHLFPKLFLICSESASGQTVLATCRLLMSIASFLQGLCPHTAVHAWLLKQHPASAEESIA